jgi:hypothetical protein
MPSGLPVPQVQLDDFRAQAAPLAARLDLAASSNLASRD